MDDEGKGNQEDRRLAHGRVEAEGDDKGQRATGKQEDGGDSEKNKVGNVVGILDTLLIAGGVTGVENGEHKHPQQPPVSDREVRGYAGGPKAEAVEQDEADENAGEFRRGHWLRLRNVDSVAGGSGLKGVVRLGPAKDRDHQEAPLEGLGRGSLRVPVEV